MGYGGAGPCSIVEVAGRLRLGFGAAGWEDEGAGVPRGPIKERAGILGRRAMEGAGVIPGEITGFCWRADEGGDGSDMRARASREGGAA